MKPRCWFPLLLLCLAVQARGATLDSLISSPDLWQSPRADFVQRHNGLGFYWLSDAHDRAESASKDLTLFGKKVYEADADFQGDKLSALTVFIYDRGDAGALDKPGMNQMVQYCYGQMTALTRVQPVTRGNDAAEAVKTWAFDWQTPATDFLLEYSFTKEVKSMDIPFRAEFVRLKVTPAEKPKSFMAEALATPTPDTPFDGPSHVKTDSSGDVYIDAVPMVDQGPKGYCVVASTERVMRYYGIPVDEHELAELANTSAAEGTDNEEMFDSLSKLTQRLHVRVKPIYDLDIQKFLNLIHDYNILTYNGSAAPEAPDPVLNISWMDVYAAMKPALLKKTRTRNHADVDRFAQTVQDNINNGLPILWSVVLGVMPERVSPKHPAGHMRLIVGYNPNTKETLYSDSWGPGFELERMPTENAWTMTTGLDTIEPF